jgi:hypothetical protein
MSRNLFSVGNLFSAAMVGCFTLSAIDFAKHHSLVHPTTTFGLIAKSSGTTGGGTMVVVSIDGTSIATPDHGHAGHHRHPEHQGFRVSLGGLQWSRRAVVALPLTPPFGPFTT